MSPPPTITTASYNVIPYPYENRFVGSIALETNPWLKAGATNNATTYGWHYDGSNNYSYTRGNNVYTYDDSLNKDSPGRVVVSTTAIPSLTFNLTPNFTQQPTTTTNRRFATTNLFYWNNIMHDVFYQYGFDESAGNFQNDNMGRGGIGSDYVHAQVQDGSGTNNANFTAPIDGQDGRMQMYLFDSSSSKLIINTPSNIAGTYSSEESSFILSQTFKVKQNQLVKLGPITGDIIFYNDSANGNTHYACYPPYNNIAGKIAFIYYNTACSVIVKAKNAQNAGAIAVIVRSPNTAGTLTGTDTAIKIPVVMISNTDGSMIATQLKNNIVVNVTLKAGLQYDGDLDNGVISHEYGHGISTRLTGGPSSSSCLDNAEQGGEGWSDYIALLMITNWATIKLTDDTLRRPMGNYVINQPATFKGIRTFPYTTNITTNPLTYDSVASIIHNGEVHYIGEVWCSALWDMTWNIIKQVGHINPNLYNNDGNGGNVIALDLVIQGMKLQKCSPGFLDSRDAILKADSIFYNSKYHCAIWAAFARRGMGYSALQGGSNSTVDQTPAFDLPISSIPYITGANAVCAGSSIIQADSLNGGIWSNKNKSIGSIDSISGLYTASAYGLDTIFYYVPNCNNYVGKIIKVNDYPTVTPIIGNSIICLGSTTVFADTSTSNKYEGIYSMKGNTVRNGFAAQTGSIPKNLMTLVTKNKNTVQFKDFQIWADSSGVGIGYPILTINPTTKKVTITSDTSLYGTGLSVPVYNNPNYNSRYDSATKTFYISFTWNTGITSRLVTDTLVYSTASGSFSSWSSSQPSVASISNTGIINTLSAGVDTIFYNLTDAYGCSDYTGKAITITALPTVAQITGNTSVCVGSNIQLVDTSSVNKYEGTYSLYSSFTRSDQPTYMGVNNYPCYLISKSATTVDLNINSIYGIITSQPFYISGNTSYSYFTGVAPRLNIDALNNVTVTVGTPAVGSSSTFTQNAAELAASKYYPIGIAGVAKTTNKKTIVAHFRWTVSGVDRIAKDTFICQNCSTFGSFWTSNDTTIAKVANTGFVTGIANGNDTINYVANNAYGCSNRTMATVKVNPLMTPSVNISTTSTSVCAGTSVSFNATPTNGGAIPIYQWNKNNVNVGSNSASYAAGILNNGDSVKCVLTSNATCPSINNVVSNTIKMIVTSPTSQNINLSGCSSVLYNGITYTSSTIKKDTLKSYQGCDSVYKVANITIKNITPATQNSSQSSCNSFIYKNITYTSSSIIKDTLKTTGGCDSIYLTINATVNPSISGRIYHPFKGNISNIKITQSGTIPNTYTVSGNYAAPCINATSNIVLRPTKNNDITKANGVTSVDVLLVQRHILNTTKLNSAYKIIAADVDGNKAVNSVDVLRMKRLILGTDTTFTSTTKGNRLWEFVDSAYQFPDTTNPFPFKDSIAFTNLTSNKINQTFIGVKLGDVNYDWNPAVAKGIATKPVELVYEISNSYGVQNPIRIKVTTNNFKEIAAMQYTLHFNNKNYEFVGIENNKLDIDFNSIQTNNNGNISFLWTDKNAIERTLEDGTELFTLVLRSTVEGRRSTDLQLTIDNSITDIAAWDKDFNQHNIVLSSKETNYLSLANNHLLIYPNPAKEFIIIDCANAKQITIIDAMGRTIKQLNNAASLNTIYTKELGNGLFIIKAIMNDGSAMNKKLILE